MQLEPEIAECYKWGQRESQTTKDEMVNHKNKTKSLGVGAAILLCHQALVLSSISLTLKCVFFLDATTCMKAGLSSETRTKAKSKERERERVS